MVLESHGPGVWGCKDLHKDIAPALIQNNAIAQKLFKENVLFWAHDNHKVGVLAILDPIPDFNLMVGNAVSMKTEYEFKNLIVVVVHGADQMNSKIVSAVNLMGIHLVPVSGMQNILKEKMKILGLDWYDPNPDSVPF